MLRSLVNTVFTLFLAVVLVLVGSRFSALLVGANADSDIVQRIYRHSDFWVKPFFGILGFENEAVSGAGVFEPASCIAFLVYLIGGLLVLAFISGRSLQRYYHA